MGSDCKLELTSIQNICRNLAKFFVWVYQDCRGSGANRIKQLARKCGKIKQIQHKIATFKRTRIFWIFETASRDKCDTVCHQYILYNKLYRRHYIYFSIWESTTCRSDGPWISDSVKMKISCQCFIEIIVDFSISWFIEFPFIRKIKLLSIIICTASKWWSSHHVKRQGDKI